MKTAKLIIVVLFMLLTAQIASAFYCPSTGRWLTRDPIGEPGFQNSQTASLSSGIRNSVLQASGRWINRDTANERGFNLLSQAENIGNTKDINSYNFVENDAADFLDLFGLKPCCCKCPVFYIYISVNPSGMPPSFNASRVQTLINSQVGANIFDSLLCGQKFKIQVRVEGSSPSVGWSPNGCVYVNQVSWTLVMGIGSSAGGVTALNPSTPASDQTWVNVLAHEVIWLNGGGHWDSSSAPSGEISSGTANASSPYAILPANKNTLRGDFPLCK